MWSKRQILLEAFAEIGIASYDFDLQADEVQTALRRLDTLMATWEAKGVRVGYNFPASPVDSDPDDASGLPDAAVETVYLNLAIRLAPGFGKAVTIETKAAARDGYDALLTATAYPIEQQLPNTMPRGAGNKPWRFDQPFMTTPDTNPLRISQGGDLNLQPE